MFIYARVYVNPEAAFVSAYVILYVLCVCVVKSQCASKLPVLDGLGGSLGRYLEL